MNYEVYVTEQRAREVHNERMVAALNENRWQKARQALRLPARTTRGR